MATVFYSWQSDRPWTQGRNLIERAFGDAIKAPNSDTELEEAERDELVLIRTQLACLVRRPSCRPSSQRLTSLPHSSPTSHSLANALMAALYAKSKRDG